MPNTTAPLVAVMLLGAGMSPPVSAQEHTRDWQLAAAVLPLPDSMRAGATVMGYRGSTELTVLRAGTNEMICLTDDPSKEGFQASCYHQSLDPFMARGRTLRAEGVTRREAIDSARLAEIESGRLRMPTPPAVLYSLFADEDAFDPLAGPPPAKRTLVVIYVPYATEYSTGLSTVPALDRPWLMFPGKPWAHVMIQR